ncbi:transferase family-domain-containing protein [Aspergillus pseudotamarii]|uniref:Transferase family-domain-containing protein n=1 Tax=Aspergillus pseudotamarii TaxID=132259 RepID=A0A5N6SDT3_ASPPS|nr:transferase family-domain-containing protein [Aspergillus pseudotamarii]KAE8131254.1 transferase family-domain-containing protein [Aspergillus pseudotamarii]
MADHMYVEQLTPLDLVMPRTYIRVLLVFQTTISTLAVTQSLQHGLDRLSKQVPWLSGRVFPSTSIQNKASLEIRSNAGDTPTLVDKGSIAATYTTLASHGLPMEAIPSEVWPVSSMIDDALSATGAPAFAASFFRFADQGVGLCVCLHHNAVDASGLSEVVRLWAQNIAETKSEFSGSLKGRIERVSKALSPDLEEIAALSSENVLALHPEYSNVPPAMPTEFAPCTSKLFAISIHRINAFKETLRKYALNAPTTNVLLCALIWTTITRVRNNRNPALESDTSRLVTAVNGRQRISERLSDPENPYFGNAVLYSLTKCHVGALTTSDEAMSSLAQLCECISESQSESTIGSRHIAEVYRLVDGMEDYRSLFAGWDLFGSRDLTITSWAALDLYGVDFGPMLGKPRFVRLPCMEADGVAIILPRRRALSEEMLEIMVMLRRDDMGFLDNDSFWQTLVSGNTVYGDDNKVA